MTIAAGNGVFVDTNVLLTATAPARPLHAQAQAVLRDWPPRGIDLALSGQVVREYLVVATRPIDVNGLGIPTAAALHNVQAILDRVRLLDEPRPVSRRLLDIVRANDLAGKRVHDANLVATALEHGLGFLVSDNVTHFRGLGDLELLELATIAIGDPDE
jgi:predicted nucleic acid-binding protein